MAITTHGDDESLTHARDGGRVVANFWLVVVADADNEYDEAKSCWLRDKSEKIRKQE